MIHLLTSLSLTPPPAAFDLPPAISAESPDVDWLYNMIYYVSIFFTVVITGLMLYWVRKYKRQKGDKRFETPHYPRLEIAWTVIPCFFVVFLFHAGFKAFMKQAIAGQDALEIGVRGQKWFWTFRYPNGREENNHLYVPVGHQVKFVISAADVLHALYVPGARIKKDAVPGMFTTLVFTPNVLGDTPIYCAEYCGAPLGYPEPALDGAPHGGHSAMMAMIHVVSQEEFDKFVKEGPKKPEGISDADWGKKLYKENACITCHTTDGSKGTGPTWKGMYGHNVELNAGLSGGMGSTMADEAYVRESITKPQAKVVMGFNPVMPPYKLSEKQVSAIIEYMKTLQ
jgi:cytochrome c oxidase subunit 2